jgi:glyceraldehyde-3-phosphate dehydrogenase/erythrose-4-phosphate dehydrogenase
MRISMTLRVGIGFRRIGRGLVHIAHDRRFEVAAINDIVDTEMITYLLRLNSNDEPATAEVSPATTECATVRIDRPYSRL